MGCSLAPIELCNKEKPPLGGFFASISSKLKDAKLALLFFRYEYAYPAPLIAVEHLSDDC